MSRSIHTTWSQLKKERNRQLLKKGAENGPKLDKMYHELKIKRDIKRQIIQERNQEPLCVATDPEVFPIIVLDENEFLHYPINVNDIRAILRHLPKGLLDGLKRIELKAGFGKEKEYDDLPDPDPYTGRPGHEILPGVFQPEVLGTYFSGERVIEVYGYVYKNIQDFGIWNVCLKIYMLTTLVHELSHHFDFQNRIGRGRWYKKEKGKIESYAEVMEYKWLNEAILPYIEETYTEDVYALNQWILQNVGIRLPLSILAGDPRKTLKNGFMKRFFPADEYFFEFAKGTYEGKDKIDAKLNLAKGFHYADMYELSLEIIEVILNSDPQNRKALNLKADTFVHQEKFDEAEQIANYVLSLNENEYDAWDVLSDVYFEKSRWTDFLSASEKALERAADNWRKDSIILRQAEVFIEAGKIDQAKSKLGLLKNSTRKHIIKRINELSEQIKKIEKQGE